MHQKAQYAIAIVETNIGIFCRKLVGKKIKFHPLSFISLKALLRTDKKTSSISLGRKTCVRAGTELHADGGRICIGDNCFINRNCAIVSHDEIKIGDGTTIGPNVCIYDHDHDGKGGFVEKSITIGKNVWIGADAVICKGVTIGDGAVIAAGGVLINDVPPGTIYGGVPARLLKRNRE